MNASPWYAGWFDSPYCHLLYRNRNEQEAQRFIDRLLKFLKPDQSWKILDIACGRGRHSVCLNSKGFDVTGIDLSEKSIEHARQFANQRLSFVLHDMREAYRENEFGLVLNLFTSFGYFEKKEDDAKVILAAKKALIPGGIFVLDFMNARKAAAALIPEETKTIEGIEFRIRKFMGDDVLVKQIAFSDKGKDFSFEERVRTYGLEDFEKLFELNGLAVQSIFGNYLLEPFNKTASERLIIVAEKPAK